MKEEADEGLGEEEVRWRGGRRCKVGRGCTRIEVGGDNKNKEVRGGWRVKRGGQRYVLRCR